MLKKRIYAKNCMHGHPLGTLVRKKMHHFGATNMFAQSGKKRLEGRPNQVLKSQSVAANIPTSQEAASYSHLTLPTNI